MNSYDNEQSSNDMENTLKELIEKDDLDAFSQLIEADSKTIFTKIELKHQSATFTLLHYTAQKGANRIAGYILSKDRDQLETGVRQSQGNKNELRGSTPLHLATDSGHLSMVDLLLVAGADVNAVRNWSVTPLYLALPDHPEIAARLLKQQTIEIIKPYYRLSPACLIARNPQLEHLVDALFSKLTPKDLLDKSENVFKKDSDPNYHLTLIHIAARENNVAFIGKICEQHADNKEIIDAVGGVAQVTPLHLAASAEISRLLIEVGKANPLTKDKNGNTALHLANTIEIADLLVEHGIPIEQENNNGLNSIAMLFAREKKAIAEHLTQKLLPTLQVKQTRDGFFPSFQLIKNTFDQYTEDTKEQLKKQLRQEAEYLRELDEICQPKWIKDAPIVYSAHNPNEEIRQHKTVRLQTEAIHQHLKFLHDQQKTKMGIKSNIICAAISFITSTTEHVKGENTSRQVMSTLLKGKDPLYYCRNEDNLFLHNISKRTMTTGNEEAWLDYTKGISKRNETKLNDNSEPEADPFHIRYMHSEQALADHLSTPETIDYLIHYLASNGITAKHKIYAIGVHIQSSLSPCKNICVENLFGLMNSKKDRLGFLNLLTSTLLNEGYKLPICKDKLPVFITYAASERHKSIKGVDMAFESKEIDINQREGNKTFLLHSFDLAAEQQPCFSNWSETKMSFFISGSKPKNSPKRPTENTEEASNDNAKKAKSS